MYDPLVVFSFVPNRDIAGKAVVYCGVAVDGEIGGSVIALTPAAGPERSSHRLRGQDGRTELHSHSDGRDRRLRHRTTVHPDGTVDPEHTSELKLTLTHGTFRINLADIDTAFVANFKQHFPTNARTCSGLVTTSAAAPVVAGSGTGAYAHVEGSFSLTVMLDEVDPTTTPCDGTKPFLAQTILISGSGTVTLA